MDLLLKILRLEWWVYVIVAVTFFTVALFLNYIVKKINEARLEERFVKIQSRASNSQSIQVQRQAETRRLRRSPLEIVLEQSNPPTVQGVSLVFDKTDNANDRNRDKIDIMNFPKSKFLAKTDDSDENLGIKLNDITEKMSENDMKPSFLGKIYRELSGVERSKSMSNAEKDSIKDEIDNILLELDKPESKSAPSVKKLLDNQNNPDFQKFSLKLTRQNMLDSRP